MKSFPNAVFIIILSLVSINLKGSDIHCSKSERQEPIDSVFSKLIKAKIAFERSGYWLKTTRLL